MAKKNDYSEQLFEEERKHGSTAPPEDGREPRDVVLANEILPSQVPVLPMDHRPLFPKMVVPMIIQDAHMKMMLSKILESDTNYIGLFLKKPSEDGETGEDGKPAPPSKKRGGSGDEHFELYETGVIARIQQFSLSPDDEIDEDHFSITVHALERIKLIKIIQRTPTIVADIEQVLEPEMEKNKELKAYSLSLIKSLKELIQLNPLHKEELKIFMQQANLSEPCRLADISANLTSADGHELQEILGAIDPFDRLNKALLLLKKEIDVAKIQVKINKQIEEKLSKQQREFFLREQLKAIKKELGLEKEGKEAEIEKFEKRIEKLELTDESKQRITEELEKLKLIETASPEFSVTRTYLDWLTILPWGVYTQDNLDIDKARAILDRDHFGLDDVKERILEFLAVGIRKSSISGTILCFVGPPGVGKTSIGRSIAESIGRRFYRFSVGGIRDEAEIKGHRRTYIGALPGKFLQAIKSCRSSNPVLMLDEIDKIGASYRGDPASALLEVLDPEQNRDFLDHYLDVRFDLSHTFFICTANQLDTIPRALLDRMEVIKLPGYIKEEKVQIARRFLLPKQLKLHGLKKGELTLTARAIRGIIDGYAREPGVRSLEKQIQKILRKSVKKLTEKKKKRIKIDREDLEEYLGKEFFTDEQLDAAPQTGVVTGLAWTSLGGDTLQIEATGVTTGKAGFKQTGQLGSVMVESSEIAYSHVRSLVDSKTPGKEFFKNTLIHLHVPAGATPKDGPSAGITMACALYSLARNKPVKKRIAMTGELTLTGRVMPIGGIKEKVIAAKRNKFKNLIFPEQNRKDFDSLPDHIKKGLRPRFVSTFDDVLRICFGR